MTVQKIRNRMMCKIVMFSLVISAVGFVGASFKAHAKEMSVNIEGGLYEFGKGSKYEISTSKIGMTILEGTKYGEFSITGNVKEVADINGVAAYEVVDSNVALTYELADIYQDAADSEWHLEEDKSKIVDDIKLDENILSGTIILQTSLTGDSWLTDVVYTDVLGEKSEYKENFYISRDIQQVNGCYYRVIVAYGLNKENTTGKSITNWNGIEQEYKKCAEVYEFYLINSSENTSGATLASDTPRKELGTKINTGKDNGYSGNEPIVNKDPHYGWDLGTFFVNGYTRETVDHNGNPVFLKNVGDRVTLWFNLKEDIYCLHGNDNLTIHEDANGYDQYFEIDKTNFKRGALIISYTDYEGKTHEPVIYTDYLAANTRTGANTKVELFEEGDYEVALNYEIKNSSGVDSYTNYRIHFVFSIRNGNCMVYPFDTVTGAELADNAMTENGFKLDMAKSRYLTVDVKKEILKSGDNSYTTDERFNRPAKDGEIYSDEGIYTFTVKNLYTENEPTVKKIYVGANPVLKALASGYSLDEINGLLLQNAVIMEDGTIVLPKIEDDVLPEPTKEPVIEPVSEKVEEKIVEIPVDLLVDDDSSIADTAEQIIDEESKPNTYIPVVIASLIIVLAMAILMVLKKRKGIKIKFSESEQEDVV